jgi:hypothetical protein
LAEGLVEEGSPAMREPGRILVLLSLGLGLSLPLLARAQDAAPSLGDIARKARQQKQSDETQAQSSKPVKVINDEDVPPQGRNSGQISIVGNQYSSSEKPAAKGGRKLTAEQWKALILAQKNQIASLQTSINQLSQSIYFHSSSQVHWNERQREKQQQVERMQTQLQEQKKLLEEMQEAARGQGYGNTVYDP